MTSEVLVNGWLSGKVEVKSGVRHGCPVMEVLCMFIKEKVMKGLMIPGSGGNNVKVLGYMDDVLDVSDNMVSMSRVKIILNLFCGFQSPLE